MSFGLGSLQQKTVLHSVTGLAIKAGHKRLNVRQSFLVKGIAFKKTFS